MQGCTHLSRFALVSGGFPKRNAKKYPGYCIIAWVLTGLRGKDLNQRPPGYEPDELPAALPRDIHLCSFELRYNTTVAIICQYLLLTFFGNIFLCRNFAMSGLIVKHLTKLRLVQLPVDAAARQELVMGPLLGDDAILDDKDAVSFQNR